MVSQTTTVSSTQATTTTGRSSTVLLSTPKNKPQIYAATRCLRSLALLPAGGGCV